MANCVNCGTKLNSFNETYPLWAEYQEKFCTRCNSKFQKFLSNNKLTHSSKLTRELFISQADSLRQNGFTDEGIRYINDVRTPFRKTYAGIVSNHLVDCKYKLFFPVFFGRVGLYSCPFFGIIGPTIPY